MMFFRGFTLFRFCWTVFVVMTCLTGHMRAQQSGHYPQGITGLDNATVAPPGIYVSFLPWVNAVRSYRGPDGNNLEDLDLNVAVHNVVFQMTTHQKFLGARYAFAVDLDAVNTRVNGAISAAAAPEPGISDFSVSPITLGWAKGRANYMAAYTFYAPTGSFDPTKSQNSGLGFWEHQIQGGMGYSFDKEELWNASALTTWEINQSKSGLDLKPGPMFNLEYSTGRRFDHHMINLGAAGYAYHKLSPDSGTVAENIPGGQSLDRSFGIGPEFKYTNPMKHFGIDFRYERQFAVQSKTQGNVYVVGLTWVNIFKPHTS